MLSERRIHEEYAKLGPIRCVCLFLWECAWLLPDWMSPEFLKLYSQEYGQFLWEIWGKYNALLTHQELRPFGSGLSYRNPWEKSGF